jgi:hypothetical protein
LSNTVSTKRINALFLSIVLIVGTIAAISPSFIIGIKAQTEPYYEKDTRYSNYEQEPEPMDNGYSVYEPDYPKYPDKKYNNYGPDYPPKYTDDRKYNSYESNYGFDNDRKSYETNSYEPTTPSYGNDNNYDKSQYQSYKPDYKPAYPSYGKEDRDKSKDSSSSVSINKLNCINNNVNINGNNTGDINVGNSGSSATGSGADEGYLDIDSVESNGVEGYDNGYNKQTGESFTCIINNNNINNNFGAGNATDGDVTEPETCEECFRAFLNANQISAYLAIFSPTTPITLEQFCNDVESGFAIVEAQFRLNLANPSVGLSEDDINALIACLENVGIGFS